MTTIILVTGANRGIGFGIVQVTAKRLPSATIVLGCRSVEVAEEAIQKLEGDGIKSTLDSVTINIEDDESISAAAESIRMKYGKLDILINNAASLDALSGTLSDKRRALNQNLNNCITSNANVTEAFMPLLRLSEFPRVLMNSSARGSLGRTSARELPPVRHVGYTVAKAGLNMLTLHLQLAEESGRSEDERITFWTVSPGHTKTGFNGFRGTKDPTDSAEAFVRLIESKKGEIPGGTFWEFEEGVFRQVPW